MQDCLVLREHWTTHIIPLCSYFRLHVLSATSREMHAIVQAWRLTCGSTALAEGRVHALARKYTIVDHVLVSTELAAPCLDTFGYAYYESLLLEMTRGLTQWLRDHYIHFALERLEQYGYRCIERNLKASSFTEAAELLPLLALGGSSAHVVLIRVGCVALLKHWITTHPEDTNFKYRENCLWYHEEASTSTPEMLEYLVREHPIPSE